MKKGIPASKGYAIGKAFIREGNDINIVERTIDNLEEEEERLKIAISKSKEQLKK
ncbi:phosphoenolpyruvate-protein phosphotransferase [Clostridium botulinum C str. Eklund]|nr:phosphoenolpyruvate-protein phosphotransferase [Clostridium botulinum C str. Eklund]